MMFKNHKIWGVPWLVINWVKGINSLENFLLRPIFEDIKSIEALFNQISFQHVYGTRNELADGLSNTGLSLCESH